MFLPGVVLVLLGYALWYTGVSNLSNGGFTQGNVQGLATSLGLDRILARAGQPASSGPITTGPNLNGGAAQPLNNPGAIGGGGSF